MSREAGFVPPSDRDVSAAMRWARHSLTAEARRIAADEVDREEMQIVREHSAELAPDPAD